MYTDENRWSYQEDAIKEIKRFFQEKRNKKGMLVIPTGGGKTLTALRGINELFNKNLIAKKVLWVSHLKTLNTQTKRVLKDQIEAGRFLGRLENVNPLLKKVTPQMLKEASKSIKLNQDEYDFIVVDEAHHSPAGSYRLIVGSGLPVLGLTATPIRLDGLSMPYESIFQVTPAELFHRGVIIQPELKTYETKLTYDINDISDDNQFDTLNNDSRNRLIVEKVFNNKKRYSKAIVFVRTKEHAKELKRFFSQENFKTKYYEKIGYILGGDENDEKGIKNEEYLEKNKGYKTSIIINCGVLTEGFDDPSINTTVMACPSKSTTFIMQCIGRALRRNPDLEDSRQKKYMVTFSDNLPNVNYRFDNFWAFGEIDDSLEPNIEKIEYDSKEDFYKQIEEVFDQKKGLSAFCKKNNFKIQTIDYGRLKTSNLILYNYSTEDYGEKWGLIYISNLNEKTLYLDKAYNWLVFNVKKYSSGRIDVPSILLQRGVSKQDNFLGTTAAKQNFWDSIDMSYQLIKKRGNEVKKINRLCYYSFFERKDIFKEELELFVSESINKESIINRIERLDENKTYWVILVPYTIIGGVKTFIIEQEVKQEILKTINYFKKITTEKKPEEFKKIIEEKSVTYLDVEKDKIHFEQILQIISDKNKIYREENTFLKVYQKKQKNKS